MRLAPDHPAFPRRVLRLEEPPGSLWAEGNLALLDRPCVAVIGSRHPSPYGVRVAFEAGRALAEAGVVVVSGAAIGLDARAHQGALDANGGTIAVLGTAIDEDYPRSNRALLGAIRARGLVLSEYAPGEEGRDWYFPARNRIIAALVRAVVVVEGRAKSGTAITVDWAEKLQVPIFAVPGRITDDLSEGPNLLLQQGVHPYLDVNCVLDLLQVPRPRRAPADQDRLEPPASRLELTGAEASLFDLITTEPAHVDVLTARSAIAPSLALAALSSLELQGLVRQLPGMHFVLAA